MLNVTFIREQWIPKLRSGEIKQGNCYLNLKNLGTDETTMCCMGVAYDLMSYKEWTPHAYWDNNQPYTTKGATSTGYLDNTTRKVIGLEKEHEVALVDLNDTQKKTFNEIADVLESWCVEQELLVVAQPE